MSPDLHFLLALTQEPSACFICDCFLQRKAEQADLADLRRKSATILLMVKKRFTCRARRCVKRFLRGYEMPKLMDEGKAHAANYFGR